MLTIHVLICIPFPGEKRPFPADDLASKKCGECWVFLKDKVVKVLTITISLLCLSFIGKSFIQSLEILTDIVKQKYLKIKMEHKYLILSLAANRDLYQKEIKFSPQ